MNINKYSIKNILIIELINSRIASRYIYINTNKSKELNGNQCSSYSNEGLHQFRIGSLNMLGLKIEDCRRDTRIKISEYDFALSKNLSKEKSKL